MEIISLPQYLNLDVSAPLHLYDYQISTAQLKNKINLTHNTFSFLVEGTKEVLTDHQPVSIENSDFLLMKSGHCLMTEQLSSHNKQYRSILFFFSNETLFEFIRKHGITSKMAHAANPIQVCAYDEYIRSFVKSLADIQKLSPTLQQKLLEVKFEEIMLYLAETCGNDFLQFLAANTDNSTSNLIRVVENNQLNKLTLKELSFLSNMSISTFKREFEKQFQTSPSRWFQDKRLEHSAHLLRNESKRPTEIFEAIGYETLSTYIQAFKAKYGMTPKQYQLQE